MTAVDDDDDATTSASASVANTGSVLRREHGSFSTTSVTEQPAGPAAAEDEDNEDVFLGPWFNKVVDVQAPPAAGFAAKGGGVTKTMTLSIRRRRLLVDKSTLYEGTGPEAGRGPKDAAGGSDNRSGSRAEQSRGFAEALYESHHEDDSTAAEVARRSELCSRDGSPLQRRRLSGQEPEPLARRRSAHSQSRTTPLPATSVANLRLSPLPSASRDTSPLPAASRGTSPLPVSRTTSPTPSVSVLQRRSTTTSMVVPLPAARSPTPSSRYSPTPVEVGVQQQPPPQQQWPRRSSSRETPRQVLERVASLHGYGDCDGATAPDMSGHPQPMSPVDSGTIMDDMDKLAQIIMIADDDDDNEDDKDKVGFGTASSVSDTNSFRSTQSTASVSRTNSGRRLAQRRRSLHTHREGSNTSLVLEEAPNLDVQA